jgi:hypothetical protein
MKNFQDWIPMIVAIWTVIAVIWLWMKIGKSGRQFFGLIAVVLAVAVFFFIQTFVAFSQKTLVATVTAVAVENKPHTLLITLKRAERTEAETYEIAGDRWFLQVAVVELQPYMHFIGMKSVYSLTRLNGQFDSTSNKTSAPINLGGFALYEKTDDWMNIPFIRSAYGNSVIKTVGEFRVYADVNGELSATQV